MAITVTIPRIVNSMVSTTAAIAWSKISKVGAALSDFSGAASVAQLPTAIPAINIANGSVDNTEFQYLDGATSNLQAQISAIGPVTLPKPSTRNSAWVGFFPGNQTPVVNGLPAFSSFGTLSDGSNANHAATKVASSSINTIGARTSASIATHQSRHDPRLDVRLITGPSIANVRFFIGFEQSGSIAADAPASHYAGIRYSTTVADTGWVGICNDGTTPQTTAQIAAIAVNTEYLMSIIFSGDGTLCTFTINGVSLTLSSHLPTTTTATFPQAQVQNLAVEAKSFALAHFYCEWD